MTNAKPATDTQISESAELPGEPGWYECESAHDNTLSMFWDGAFLRHFPQHVSRIPRQCYKNFRRLVPASEVDELRREVERLTRQRDGLAKDNAQLAKENAQLLIDNCTDCAAIQKAAATVLGNPKVYGDSHGVPGVVDVVEMLVEKLAQLEAECERLRPKVIVGDTPCIMPVDHVLAAHDPITNEVHVWICQPNCLSQRGWTYLDFGIPQFPASQET